MKEIERLKRSGEVYLVPFDKIVIDEEFNSSRIDLGDLEGLSVSIGESGLKTPLLLRKSRGEDTYVLMQGKRRFKAIEMLIKKGEDFPFVKAFLAKPEYNLEANLLDEITMNDGKPYSNLEQGSVFSKLLDRGYTVSDIAKKTGKSNTHINNCMEVAALPKKVRDMVASKSVSGATAVELSKNVNSENELIEKLETAVNSAPTNPEGAKKKVTKKNIEQIASLSPLKKLDKVKEALDADGVTTGEYHFFVKLLSRLKAGEPVESLVELFKNER